LGIDEALDSRGCSHREYLEVSFIRTAAQTTFDSFRKIKNTCSVGISARKEGLPL